MLRRLHSWRVLRIVDDTAGIFHPKLLIALKDHKARVLFGSSNFTNGGFAGNTEVNVLLSGDRSEKVIHGFLTFINQQWNHPRSKQPDPEWFKAYEKRYASRPRPPKPPRPPKSTGAKPANIKTATDLRLTWPQYVKLLRQRERSLQSSQMHVFEHRDGSWLEESEKCHAAFRGKPLFKDMSLEARKLVAGWGGQSKGYFGWMRAAGRFKTLTAAYPGRIGKFLDPIPLTGAVSRSDAERCLDGLMSLQGCGFRKV